MPMRVKQDAMPMRVKNPKQQALSCYNNSDGLTASINVSTRTRLEEARRRAFLDFLQVWALHPLPFANLSSSMGFADPGFRAPNFENQSPY